MALDLANHSVRRGPWARRASEPAACGRSRENWLSPLVFDAPPLASMSECDSTRGSRRGRQGLTGDRRRSAPRFDPITVTVQGERPALVSCQDAHFSKNSQEGGKFGRTSYEASFLSARLPVNSGSFSGVSPVNADQLPCPVAASSLRSGESATQLGSPPVEETHRLRDTSRKRQSRSPSVASHRERARPTNTRGPPCLAWSMPEARMRQARVADTWPARAARGSVRQRRGNVARHFTSERGRARSLPRVPAHGHQPASAPVPSDRNGR
jgi:hypothetical protein